MRNSFLIPAFLGASALAAEHVSRNMMGMGPSIPASCENKISAAGLQPGLSDQLVTIVQVADANGALKYFPDNVVAPVGSIVQFQFNPKNHTVTESSFADPCKPIAQNLTSPSRPGQRSGFVPVTPQDTDIKVYNLLVNDTKPIWIYCGQASHCQQGMSMVINQNMNDTEKTIQKYQEKAAQLPPAPGTPAPPAAASNSSTPTSTTDASRTTGSVATGAASGTPAGLSFANARMTPFHNAGIVGLTIAAAAFILL